MCSLLTSLLRRKRDVYQRLLTVLVTSFVEMYWKISQLKDRSCLGLLTSIGFYRQLTALVVTC
jgi:hypothetical protein